MTSPLTHEIYADAARALGWSPFTTLLPTDIPFVVSRLRLDVRWIPDHWVSVSMAGGPGHVERVAGDSDGALFTAVVMCAALIGGAGQ